MYTKKLSSFYLSHNYTKYIAYSLYHYNLLGYPSLSICTLTTSKDNANISYLKQLKKLSNLYHIKIYPLIFQTHTKYKHIQSIFFNPFFYSILLQRPFFIKIKSPFFKTYDTENSCLLSNNIPCTARACIYFLNKLSINIKGTRFLIIGYSLTVGNPITKHLIKQGASISICNEFTKNLYLYSNFNKIIISATGQSNLIQQYHISSYSTIFDIGFSNKTNFNIVGDVNPSNLLNFINGISLVPKGIGPLTTVFLLENSYFLYKSFNYIKNTLSY